MAAGMALDDDVAFDVAPDLACGSTNIILHMTACGYARRSGAWGNRIRTGDKLTHMDPVFTEVPHRWRCASRRRWLVSLKARCRSGGLDLVERHYARLHGSGQGDQA